MDKFFKGTLIFFSAIISLSMLFSFVKLHISSVIIIVILGIINYLFETFVEYELNRGMNFFNKLSKQVHPIIYRVWNSAKNIILVLLLQYFGFDLLSTYFDSNKDIERIILFDGVVFVGGITVIIMGISMAIKFSFGENFIKYTNNRYKFKIKIPSYWRKIRVPNNSQAIMAFNDEMSDKCCYIFVDEKINYDETATLNDFIFIHLEGLRNIPDVEVLNINKKINDHDLLYEIPILIMKKKYIAYISFLQSNDYYFAIRVVLPEKYKQLNEYQDIIKSVEIFT